MQSITHTSGETPSTSPTIGHALSTVFTTSELLRMLLITLRDTHSLLKMLQKRRISSRIILPSGQRSLGHSLTLTRLLLPSGSPIPITFSEVTMQLVQTIMVSGSIPSLTQPVHLSILISALRTPLLENSLTMLPTLTVDMVSEFSTSLYQGPSLALALNLMPTISLILIGRTPTSLLAL